MIDFYAIRAEDYTFLQQMYLEWEVCLHVCASGGWEGWEGDVHVGGYMYQWVFVCMRGICVCVCGRVFECGCMQVFLCV